MDVELVGADRFDCSNHDRQIFGLTSSHYRVYCDLLDGHVDQVRSDIGHDVRSTPGGALEHAHDPSFGWRHKR